MQEVHITLAMLPNGSITMHSERQCNLDTALILFDAFALRDKFKEWDNKPTETKYGQYVPSTSIRRKRTQPHHQSGVHEWKKSEWSRQDVCREELTQ